ncbi:Citrate transporter [Methanolacinia petrolearia DSM 11571]|uniref:Citrate transporter n=1 Tax=Methanolacinia petrolearia (strain DSM 11571 / OCM 486 / SEBR 4847) TaxID=679926 RepID=E1RJI1_METP4|nr:GntP family permease [Methanolacinia petrolearia]ADN36787.1 Citrate transporter [Methanolacinia petrolearia DSM 11571]
MDPVLVLILTLAFITVLAFSRKVPTFVFLFSGAVFLGLLAGFGFEQVLTWAIEGMGNIFSSFAVIILSGIVIVRLLSDQSLLDIIISGLRFGIKDRGVNAGIIGYILSIPTTCCITTYLMIAPAMKKPGDKTPGSNRPLYLVAVGSIISYVLIFPTPATIPLLTGLAPDYPVFNFDAITIPLSFGILVIILLLSGFLYRKTKRETVESVLPEEKVPAGRKIRAWAPFIVMFAAIPVGLFLLQLSHLILTQFIMLAGMITALALAPPDIRMKSFSKGAKFAGLILFDFCSAGAVGKVIVGSGIANGIMDSMIPVLPDILVPFIIAAVFATVQGSRVVTAVISSEIIATAGLAETLHPVPLILMVSAGTCFISYLTDPYFWLVQRTTGDDITTVMKHYTLPLAVAAVIIFVVALLLTVFFFPYVENAALLV